VIEKEKGARSSSGTRASKLTSTTVNTASILTTPRKSSTETTSTKQSKTSIDVDDLVFDSDEEKLSTKPNQKFPSFSSLTRDSNNNEDFRSRIDSLESKMDNVNLLLFYLAKNP